MWERKINKYSSMRSRAGESSAWTGQVSEAARMDVPRYRTYQYRRRTNVVRYVMSWAEGVPQNNAVRPARYAGILRIPAARSQRWQNCCPPYMPLPPKQRGVCQKCPLWRARTLLCKRATSWSAFRHVVLCTLYSFTHLGTLWVAFTSTCKSENILQRNISMWKIL